MSANLNPLPLPQEPAKKPVLVPAPEEPKGKPSWLIWGSLLVLLVASVAAWQWYSAQQEAEKLAAIPAVRTAKARVAPLHQTVRITGVTTARNFANITVPKLTGPEGNRPMTILKMAASGTMVKKGQIVLEIDGQSLQDHVDDVNATVMQAQGDILKRKAEQALDIENLEQNIRVAKSELDKVRLDAKTKELRTALDQELLQLAVEESDAKYKQLLKDMDFKKQSQASEMRILQYTMERHMRHRDRHKADLKKFVVSAAMDGLAVVQPVFRGSENDTIKVGDIVAPGQVAMKIVDPKSMQVEGNINQTEVSQFRIGETAKITVDAFPGMSLKGRLYSVGALAVMGGRQQSFIRTIPVRVAIEGFDPKLIPDLSAAAEVLTGTGDDKAVLIPRGAIHEQDGKTFVFAKQGVNFVKREVKTGDMNDTQIVIQSGVSAGEEVALNYSQPLPQVASR
ncbi:MAG: HlyD family efflux transporter periplasmic adaptor subunit [Acidobacteria bacterium]|nr:HlyD family efflux transporter periplasmic adaptor subunit [Acidobacteriota bacterium]